MANIRPIGIDQTTGQQSALNPTDTIVDQIGNQIEIGITETGDYSTNPNIVTPIFPWSTSPTTRSTGLSTANGWGASWAPNGEYLAVAIDASPFIAVLQRVGTTFISLPTPPSPPSSATRDVAWSFDGQFLAFSHVGTGGRRIYQRDGSDFTALSPPALPGDAWDVAWSPNGEFVSFAHDNSPFATTFQRDGTTFTKIPDPVTLPASSAFGLGWSYDNQYLAVAHSTFPFQSVYIREGDGTALTKLANAAVSPGGTGDNISWHPSRNIFAIGTNSIVRVYEVVGTTITLIATPQGSAAGGSAWHPSGKYLAAADGSNVNIYEYDGDTTFTLTDSFSVATAQSMSFTFDGQFLAAGSFSAGTEPAVVKQTTTAMPDSGIVIFR